MDNLYDEMRVMRAQLLNRIELLEDEVDYFIRLAYSGISAEDIDEGLKKLKSYFEH